MARSSKSFLLKEAAFREVGTPVVFDAHGKRLDLAGKTEGRVALDNPLRGP
jgi:hypothetical protein